MHYILMKFLLMGIKSRAPHSLGEHWAASAFFFSLPLLRQGHTKWLKLASDLL